MIAGIIAAPWKGVALVVIGAAFVTWLAWLATDDMGCTPGDGGDW